MPIAACPFCFSKIDTSRLAYQCTNRNGRCEKSVDETRLAMTQSNALSYPTFMPNPPPGRGGDAACPQCNSAARRRACPRCHTAVPADFVDSDSPLLAIVGSTGAGKTVYMTVLAKRLRETVGARFGASVRIATDDPDKFDNLEDYIADREGSIYERGNLPQKTNTALSETRRPLAVLWQGQKRNLLGRLAPFSTILSFVDTSGEDLARVEDAFTLRYLSVADALIIALDPFALPGARDTLSLPSTAIQSANPADVVSRITEVLRNEHGLKRGKKIKIPVAIVFTKMDAFFPSLAKNNPILTAAKGGATYDEQDGQAVHEHMRALLHQWGAGNIDTDLQLNYATYRFFGVSALGAEPDYNLAQVAAGGVRPHRVEDPLLWLLAKEGAVASE
jgi:hypothetical protein